MRLSRNIVTHLYYYDRQIIKKKHEPNIKQKIFEKLRIKHQVTQYKKSMKKVKATKKILREASNNTLNLKDIDIPRQNLKLYCPRSTKK